MVKRAGKQKWKTKEWQNYYKCGSPLWYAPQSIEYWSREGVQKPPQEQVFAKESNYPREQVFTFSGAKQGLINA